MNYPPLIAISCFILYIKFILFLRAIEAFGIYFTIMISVARKIFSFLVILFLIILSFASAFLELLHPASNIEDKNIEWDLTDTYDDNKDEPNITLYKKPDKYTYLFRDISGSLLAIYLFLTGI